MKNIQIINRGIKINTADSERPVALHVGSIQFPKCPEWLVIPGICVSSAVLFTLWCLASVPCLHAPFGKMQTSPHWVSSKAELVLPFIFVKPAGAARLGHLGPWFLSQWRQRFSSLILLIGHGHSITLLAGIIHLNLSVFLCTIFPWHQGIIWATGISLELALAGELWGRGTQRI